MIKLKVRYILYEVYTTYQLFIYYLHDFVKYN